MKRSWIDSANDPEGPFPLNNLPCGVFSTPDKGPRCGVAIGDQILDLQWLEGRGLIDADGAFGHDTWNAFMAQGPVAWRALRHRLTQLLEAGAKAPSQVSAGLVAQSEAVMHLPVAIGAYTDFYASRHHATNVGTMFRGAENALPPNWLHMPIGYNGRASSVVVSGTDVRRPWGQLKPPEAVAPCFAPSERFDFELELGAIVGVPSDGPLTVAEADAHIFGYVLLNDWSARDIQSWEYQPLGPFLSKATATSISPWVVMSDALAPVRCCAPDRAVPLLEHLQDEGAMHFDIDLTVTLTPAAGAASPIARTNARELYYSAAQQLAHHTSSGCPMRVGDLLGSGTISGPDKDSRGSMLELSWGGGEPIALTPGEVRSFLEDGDCVTLEGQARADGYTIGFGSCAGRLLPALADPYAQRGPQPKG